MSVYRSGRREKPSALSGHTFTIIDAPDGFDDDPEAFPETPMLLRCLNCHVIRPSWWVREGYLITEPCAGRVAALAPPPDTQGVLL